MTFPNIYVFCITWIHIFHDADMCKGIGRASSNISFCVSSVKGLTINTKHIMLATIQPTYTVNTMTGNRTKNINLPLDYHYKPSKVTLQMGF